MIMTVTVVQKINSRAKTPIAFPLISDAMDPTIVAMDPMN